MQGLNSPNEDQTQGPCIGSTESTTGRPGNSLVIFLNGSWPHIFSVKSQLVSFADASPGLFVVWLSLAGAWNGNSKGNIFKWNSFSPARRRGWKDPGNHRRLVCRGSAARVSMNQGSRDPRRWMRLEAEPSCQFLPFPAALYPVRQQVTSILLLHRILKGLLLTFSTAETWLMRSEPCEDLREELLGHQVLANV